MGFGTATGTVKFLFDSPIKSCKQRNVRFAEFSPIQFGIDRLYMIIGQPDEAAPWQFCAQRALLGNGIAVRDLYRLHVTDYAGQIVVTDIKGTIRQIMWPHEMRSNEYYQVLLWGNKVWTQEISPQASAWCTEFINDCGVTGTFKIVTASQPYNRGHGMNVTFPDRHPIHLVTTSSLHALSKQCGLPEGVLISRFRPNMVIDMAPGNEARFTHSHIRGCPMDIIGPTERCGLINLTSGTTDKNREPLATLARLHKAHGGSGPPSFGIHIRPQQVGSVFKGDEIVFSS